MFRIPSRQDGVPLARGRNQQSRENIFQINTSSQDEKRFLFSYNNKTLDFVNIFFLIEETNQSILKEDSPKVFKYIK